MMFDANLKKMILLTIPLYKILLLEIQNLLQFIGEYYLYDDDDDDKN